MEKIAAAQTCTAVCWWDGGGVEVEGGWRDQNELWTDRITSSHMYFRGLKPDTHAIVILNHCLGKPGPRSYGVAVPGGAGQREGVEGYWGIRRGVQKNGHGGRWRINHPDELRGEFSRTRET